MIQDSRYFGQLGQLRERAAVARWMYGHCAELLSALGLRKGWWCGLFLDRRDVFDDGSDGDVDLIAGPLNYTLSDEEFEARVWAERRKSPFNPRMPHHAEAMAHSQAGQDGCVEWPPRIRFVTAYEAKASHYDGKVWKATHVGERRKIRGQLDYLCERGVNRVALLHIGATAPSKIDPASWEVANAQMAAAERDFPDALGPDANPGYGSFRVLMAAVHGYNEGLAGIHSPLKERASAALLNDVVEQPWHAHLRTRLEALGRPNYLRTYVLACPSCTAWQLSPSADPTAQKCLRCEASMVPS